MTFAPVEGDRAVGREVEVEARMKERPVGAGKRGWSELIERAHEADDEIRDRVDAPADRANHLIHYVVSSKPRGREQSRRREERAGRLDLDGKCLHARLHDGLGRNWRRLLPIEYYLIRPYDQKVHAGCVAATAATFAAAGGSAMIHRCHLARNRHPMLHPENLQPVHQKVKHELALLQGVDHERLHPIHHLVGIGTVACRAHRDL